MLNCVEKKLTFWRIAMAASGASFRKPLLSSLMIDSLREARERIVLINSKTLLDSPDASRLWKHKYITTKTHEATTNNKRCNYCI